VCAPQLHDSRVSDENESARQNKIAAQNNHPNSTRSGHLSPAELESGGIRHISRFQTFGPSVGEGSRLNAPEAIAAISARTDPHASIDRITVSLVESGNSTDAVKITDSITRTAITAPVNRFKPRVLAHGPTTSLSLHKSSRKTVALGSRTPARVCTALVRRSSGAFGVNTRPAAIAIRPQ
jgi:hypothetical protein